MGKSQFFNGKSTIKWGLNGMEITKLDCSIEKCLVFAMFPDTLPWNLLRIGKEFMIILWIWGVSQSQSQSQIVPKKGDPGATVEGAAAEIPGIRRAPGGRTAEDREGSAERLPGGEWVVVGSWWSWGTYLGHGKSPGGDFRKINKWKGIPHIFAVLKVGNWWTPIFRQTEANWLGLGCWGLKGWYAW